MEVVLRPFCAVSAAGGNCGHQTCLLPLRGREALDAIPHGVPEGAWRQAVDVPGLVSGSCLTKSEGERIAVEHARFVLAFSFSALSRQSCLQHRIPVTANRPRGISAQSVNFNQLRRKHHRFYLPCAVMFSWTEPLRKRSQDNLPG